MIEVDKELNKVCISDTVRCSSNKTQIFVIGKNNSIKIGNNVSLQDSHIRLKGNNINLEIEDNVQLTGVVASLFQNTNLFIGENSTLGKGEITVAEECSVHIGKDCMFAHGYEIRNSDMHPIYNLQTGERINNGSSVFIEDHVWAGRDVVILKGVSIASNVVLGIRSVVSKDIKNSNSIAIGLPAKVVREGVVWGRMMYHKTMYDDPTLINFV